MNEIEVKFAVDSFDAIRARVESAGFSSGGMFTERVRYYDSLDRKWASAGVTIRTKTVNGRTVVTVKKKVAGEYKSSVEKECEVIDPKNELEGMLSILGLRTDLEYTKQREHFTSLGLGAVELDSVEEIGAKYIELETESEEKMSELIKELAVDGATQDMRSYPNIIREFRNIAPTT